MKVVKIRPDVTELAGTDHRPDGAEDQVAITG
jgi:hypothetical protein